MSNLRSLLGTESATLAGIYSGGVGRLKPGQTYYFNIVNDCVGCNTIDYTRCNDGNTTDARGCPVTGGGFETIMKNATVLCCWKPPMVLPELTSNSGVLVVVVVCLAAVLLVFLVDLVLILE
jgi:hypothetical protein